MEMILLRHGMAFDIGENGITNDEERMLTPKGKRRTVRMCELLMMMNYRPDVILSSPLIRAMETADIVSEILKLPAKTDIAEFLTPSFRQEHAIEALKKINVKSIILIGHMPNLSYLGTSLISGKSAINGLDLKKSGACCISFQSLIKEGSGQLKWLLQPQQFKIIKSIT